MAASSMSPTEQHRHGTEVAQGVLFEVAGDDGVSTPPKKATTPSRGRGMVQDCSRAVDVGEEGDRAQQGAEQDHRGHEIGVVGVEEGLFHRPIEHQPGDEHYQSRPTSVPSPARAPTAGRVLAGMRGGVRAVRASDHRRVKALPCGFATLWLRNLAPDVATAPPRLAVVMLRR